MVGCMLTSHEAQTSATSIRKWQWSFTACSQKSYLNTEVFHCHTRSPHLETQPTEQGTLQEQSSLAAPREGAEFLSGVTMIAVTAKPRHTAGWLLLQHNKQSSLGSAVKPVLRDVLWHVIITKTQHVHWQNSYCTGSGLVFLPLLTK